MIAVPLVLTICHSVKMNTAHMGEVSAMVLNTPDRSATYFGECTTRDGSGIKESHEAVSILWLHADVQAVAGNMHVWNKNNEVGKPD